MHKEENVIIDGFTFQIRQLQVRPARSLLVKLFNVLGPAFGEAITQANASDGDSSEGVAIGSALVGLSSAINDEDLDYIQDTLLGSVSVMTEGGAAVPALPIVNSWTAGELSTLGKLLLACLKVNYASFLADTGLSNLFEVMQTASPKPATKKKRASKRTA